MSNRWERLLDQKPVTLRQHLLDEAARCCSSSSGDGRCPSRRSTRRPEDGWWSFSRPDSPRPSAAVFPAALRLVRWELGRDHEAYDEYMRNRRYQETGIPEGERPALLLVSRWVLEQLLSLSDATGGRVDRRALVGVVDRLERGLGGGTVSG